jgi:putative redox protein
MNITLARVNDRVHLRATNPEGNTVDVDGAERVGGRNGGFRPMQLVLAAIASCATMDLVPILEKQRQRLDDLHIDVTGERGEGGPSPFTSIHLHYTLVGRIDEAKARRAIELAVYKYCSVGEMLKATVDITYSFEIHSGGEA